MKPSTISHLDFRLLAIGVLAPFILGQSAEFKIGRHTFTVPDGFEVELVAGPPLVNRPIEADFDEQGRLYVTDSSGSNAPVKQQLEEKPHRVVRLEDSDGDGVFDKSLVFADKMMFPEGALWHDRSLYVAAPPSIWKLTDMTGDGVADHREEWFKGKTLTGCANDLHGPYLGLDGWIYWTKGAFAEQTYQRPGKEPFVTRAAHIFRSRPDGTGIEAVMTGGMDNPVGVTFSPEGERFFSTTFFQHPAAGKRDGLVHAIYGGVYGKIHSVLDGHPRTGDVMPVLTHFGAGAPCGLTRYESKVFGDDYQDNLFSCQFNLRRVQRHILTKKGSSYVSEDMDFIVSDNRDFHPTDVLEDADGSLIVIDTGGWYKLCCPTAQLHKPDILGGIYRIRRTGAQGPKNPRGLDIDWETIPYQDVAKLLDDPRPAVQKRAIDHLGRGGNKGAAAIRSTMPYISSPAARRNAVWALTRIEEPSARRLTFSALVDRNESVAQAALHSVSIHRHAEVRSRLEEFLDSPNRQLRRVAAEALGRIGDRRSIEALLTASAVRNDRALEHSLIFAMIEIEDPNAVAQGLKRRSTRARRAALIALDQMPGGHLRADQVIPYLVSDVPLLKETASWIVGHHPEWGSDLANYFRESLLDSPTAEAGAELEQLISNLASEKAIQNLVVDVLTDGRFEEPARALVLQSMAKSGIRSAPSIWSATLVALLMNGDGGLRSSTIATIKALSIPDDEAALVNSALLRLAELGTLSEETRLEALAAAPAPIEKLESHLFDLLVQKIDPRESVSVRSSAAAVLSSARLSSDQLLILAENIGHSGPLGFLQLLSAFERSGDKSVGLALLSGLKSASGLAVLNKDVLTHTFERYPQGVREAADDFFFSIQKDAPEKQAHLDQLAASIKDGDIRRGQSIFHSERAACYTCHSIGYLGGNAGPDLTKIGQVRSERDLLEAIVFPSASFVRSYEPMRVSTEDGLDYNGYVRDQNVDEIILVTGPNAESRIAKSQVVEIQPSSVSIMPGGLDEQLTKQELADLVAFLKGTKWGP